MFASLYRCAADRLATTCRLMRSAAGRVTSDVVEMYNSNTGAWSTAVLSLARWALAATSVGNVALFAGGSTGGALLCIEHIWRAWLLTTLC